MKKILTTSSILTTNIRVLLYLFSLSTLLFARNYCVNVCPFLDSLTNEELTFNLVIVFIFHIVTREILYKTFSEPFKNLTLPRHLYYLSIFSWIIAGIFAFLLHYFKYPNFPLGSHIKLLSSYWVLGAGILAQLEYIIFEKQYKKIAVKVDIAFYTENISRRIVESFTILAIAPAITILLILARYNNSTINNSHLISEIAYIVILFVVTAILSAILFGQMLKHDTHTIIQNIDEIKNGNYAVDIDIKRADELGEISNAIEIMANDIGRLNNEIISTQSEIVNTMGEIAETRSKETGNHVKRVALYSELLALKYGLSPKEATLLKQASPMHDIGKVGIPDNILNKPGRHTDEESIIMKTHAILGYEILKTSNRPILKAASIVAYEHHEKWNGTGYPRGLSGEAIHIYGRITALADVFDALGSERCYKKAWEDERIFTLFQEERGKHFDPKIVDIFFENVEEFKKIRDSLRDVL
jgi:response regulator RpfG family c-di-GMP phosphodiesterase